MRLKANLKCCPLVRIKEITSFFHISPCFQSLSIYFFHAEAGKIWKLNWRCLCLHIQWCVLNGCYIISVFSVISMPHMKILGKNGSSLNGSSILAWKLTLNVVYVLEKKQNLHLFICHQEHRDIQFILFMLNLVKYCGWTHRVCVCISSDVFFR